MVPTQIRNPLQRIEHNTLQEQVYSHIRQGLIDGQFKPGQVLTIRYLAEQLGTSIMPVREALQKLTVERVVDLMPTRSVRVPVLSPAEFAEICDARMILEGSLTELATERATAEDIARIDKASQEFLAAGAAGDATLLLRKNREFHFSIYAAARHATLTALIEPLWARSGPCTLALFEDLTEEQIKRAASSLHHKAFEAIRRRKPAAARDAIVTDILATSKRYQQHHAKLQSGSGA
jgi:DNA-binding GntR family transcriptional regulator